MASKVQIRALGNLQVTYNDAPLSDFVPKKVPALLAYLALTQSPHT